MTDRTDGDREPVAPADVKPEVDAEVISDLDVQVHAASDVKGGLACRFATVTTHGGPVYTDVDCVAR